MQNGTSTLVHESCGRGPSWSREDFVEELTIVVLYGGVHSQRLGLTPDFLPTSEIIVRTIRFVQTRNCILKMCDFSLL